MERGDFGAVWDEIATQLFLARAAEANPNISGYLVSIGLDLMASNTIENCLPLIKTGAKAGQVDPATIRRLIGDLLDDRHKMVALRQAFRGERVMQIDFAELYATGKTTISDLTGEPHHRLENFLPSVYGWGAGVLSIHYMNAAIATVETPDWPACKKAVPPRLRLGERELNPELALAGIISASADGILLQHYLGLSRRRMAAIALAIKLYSADHEDQLPPRLEDLVPNYLPALPLDSLTDGRVVSYIATGDHPRLYSVGRDGKDNQGRARTPEMSAKDAIDTDEVFELTAR